MGRRLERSTALGLIKMVRLQSRGTARRRDEASAQVLRHAQGEVLHGLQVQLLPLVDHLVPRHCKLNDTGVNPILK